MRLTPLRRRLALAYMGLVLAVLSLAGLYLLDRVSDLFIESMARDLTVRAALVRDLTISEEWPWPDNTAGDVASARLGSMANSRVTVIAADGTVLGESEQPSATMVNHADRHEFIQAMAGGVGVSRRFSETREERLLYVAVPLRVGPQIVAAVRLSVSLEWVWARIAAIRAGLAVALGGSLLLAATVGIYLGGRMITIPLGKVVDGARRMLGGDLATRIDLETGDEWQVLATSLNAMAASLNRQLQSLEAERTRVRNSLEGLPDGVLLLAPEGSLLTANRRARDWLALAQSLGDYVPESARVGPWRPAIAPRRREAVDLLGRTLEVRDFVADALASGGGLRREVSLRGPASARLEVTSSWVGTSHQSDLVIVLHDVSEIRRLESARRDLVANVSHELKTPIGAIRVLAETLVADPSPSPTLLADFLGRIVRETERLAGLVDQMLYLSRLESEVDPLALVVSDLGDMMSQSVHAVTSLAQAKSINLACDPGSDTQLRCDPVRVGSAITALLDNAIKFSPPGTTVSVRTASLADEVEFVIHDEGPGIPSEVLERVWERFYKADESRRGPGTGLGLAIVKHVVVSHGGRVFARSTVGRGSTFGFALPRRSV